MEFREAIERDAQDLQALARRVAEATRRTSPDDRLFADLAACGNDHRAQERRLDLAALELRRRWLAIAHRPADMTLKSPRAGEVAHVPCGDDVRFGYERELDASLLEDRGERYLQAPPGWTADLVLFRSGQAALACLLQFAASRWGQARPLSVAHAGAYFETASLLQAWPRRMFRPARAVPGEQVDLLIAEPVWCDGSFGCAGELPQARRGLLLDTTMVGPRHDLAPYLSDRRDGCPLVIAYSSGLKLDQAGLELANVGIVRILAREGDSPARDVGDRLRHLRGLTGSGLTLDELSALSAPWFMDRGYVDRYTAAIFASNRALAGRVGTRSAIFGAACHPSLAADAAAADAEAPFCAFELRDASPARYRRLVEIVERESDRRGLLVAKGGSFGFRGHRFELIEPEPGQGRTFLRVALGWRGGHSCRGLCDLFGELAAHPSFDSLDRAMLRAGS